MISKQYRFPNGARLATGPKPSVVPAWAPTQLRVPVTRSEAAKALWEARGQMRKAKP